jgi:hypothetical protein
LTGGTEVLLSPTARLLSEGNPGPAEIEGIVELRPALRAKQLEKAFADLVAGGKRPHPAGARRATRSSSAPPSGISATKAGSPHRRHGRPLGSVPM